MEGPLQGPAVEVSAALGETNAAGTDGRLISYPYVSM